MRRSSNTLAVGLLAAGTLIFETTLTRFLGVAQFYHFAFLVVSLALLGLGASGTLLTLFPDLKTYPLTRVLMWVALGFPATVGAAYAGVNWIPFDSYSIAWEHIQVLYFGLYYLVLSLPFLVSGLGVGIALAHEDENHHAIYSANLIGSAVGALLTPLAQAAAGVPGAVLLSGLMALSALFVLAKDWVGGWNALLRWGFSAGVVVFILFTFQNLKGRSAVGMTLSPYKALSRARRVPGSELEFGAWNAVSRVDVMSDAGTRKLPGLSYQFPENPPRQLGLSVDGGALQPITLVDPDSFTAAAWMPEGLPMNLMKSPHVVVLKPGGGLGVLQALAGGADQVTAVIENPLLLKAAAETSGSRDAYQQPRVKTVIKHDRAFLQQTEHTYDLVLDPLTGAFRPVTSGAFSLSEEYSMTVEAYQDMYEILDRDGLLVVTRWLQNPPSESLKAILTLFEAGQQAEIPAMSEKLVIYRGVQTMTILVRPAGWEDRALSEVRSFLESRRFDMVWAPDVTAADVNRFNQLPEPMYYQEVKRLLESEDQEHYVNQYPFDISAPRDFDPFFHHYFTWDQTPQVLSTLGQTWQPFGGSGYFILLALLGLVFVLSAVLILLPLGLDPGLIQGLDDGLTWKVMAYFALIGLGFMLVEIPLIQRWILYVGHPIYAFAIVVGSLLFFSGWGSLAAKRLDWGSGSWLGMILAALFPLVLLSLYPRQILAWAGWLRVIVLITSLAPLGFLMGIPFPSGLSRVKENAPRLTPWAWAVNGFTSVIASVLASILALSYGVAVVFAAGVGAYLAAAAVYRVFPD